MEESDDYVIEPPGGRRVIVENFPNGVLVLFDADLRYRLVGPETLPFSGRRAADMVGETIYELFSAETCGELEPALEATIDGEQRSLDVEHEERVHHVETRPVRLEGESYGILTTQEVTAKRETERQLKRQNERLDQFASLLTHDLRNPLSMAIASLQVYQENGDDSALADVESALGRIDELTEDLLSLARGEAAETESESVDLDEVALQAWEMVATRSAALVTEPVIISAQESQLSALFENLFTNAVGHGGDGVTVRVGALEHGFYVEDTGVGIPPEEREAVFDHGFTTSYEGSGFGLTIVSRIAEVHGWTVSLTESKEGGARFEFHDAAEER
ncbi:sensor histidine kinase [Haloarchaeobius amylolyticus]|uniref:sensor histidine kinase n=1 Tax=Haloarchaeobius amylolyticus TaxID=1198296 RepID=UPI00226F0CD8|nr:PAS domain-containing sensor histidine kinase [Haloarchaeobius amylolyticus]